MENLITTLDKPSWNVQKYKLKTQFPTLKAEDLKYTDGRKDEMLTKVQDKLGKTKEELAKIISSL
jgi:uncharacterized protein YjbJ (UPF0337 family)